MKKICFWLFTAAYVLSYLISIRFLPQEYIPLAENIFSFVGSGTATGILLISIRNKKLMKKYQLALLLAVAFCFLGDLTMSSHGKSYGTSFTNMMYISGTLSLAVAIYFLMESSLKKWDGIKIFLDGFILGMMLFYISWALIYNNIVTYLLFDNFSDPEKLYYLFFLVINLFMVFGLLLFYLFNQRYLREKSNILEAAGFMIWFAGDLGFLYLQLYQKFQTSYFVNLLWTLALIFLSVSATVPKKFETKNTAEELGLYSGKNIFFNLLIVFLGIVLFTIAPTTFLVILPLIIFRILFARYIKISRYNVILIENANLDPLTKIFNRKKFTEELEKSLSLPSGTDCFVLAILEISRFKYINSFYGYRSGDRILMDSARRLEDFIGERGILGRWNGDEFIFLLSNVSDREEAGERCTDILNLFKEPFSFEDSEITCSVNIGSAMVPDDSYTPDELVRFADSALIKAIHQGKNRVFFYEKNIGLEEEYREL